MAENKHTIVEGYTLPSKSKLYSKQFNPAVELRPMTVREEMRRNSQTNRPYKMLADIIQDCLITKLPINVYDMCIGDYEYLLHKLRVVSYGPDYKMTVICPVCGKMEDKTIDLDSLPIHEYTDDEWNQEVLSLLTLTLPVSGKLVTLKYQTPRMLDDIAIRKAELEKKKIDYDPTMQLTLQACIDTVDGEPMSYAQLEGFTQKLQVRDAKAILKNINKLTRKVGLDTTIDHTCAGCGFEVQTNFRFGREFFEPVED